MKIKMNFQHIFLFSALFALIGCHDSNSLEDSDNYWDIGNGAQVSGCGGFDGLNREYVSQSVQNDDCTGERLLWKYDPESQLVRFLNQNVWLNCCGDHSIVISMNEETGVYIIDEIDQPEPNSGRCHCMCFYDYAADLPDITIGKIKVELYRYSTDQEPRFMVWDGLLDLSEGEGDELIDENVGYCN